MATIAVQKTNAEFLLNNWNKIIEIGITTEEQLRKIADTHIKHLNGEILTRLIEDKERRRKNQLLYYKKHYVGDSPEQLQNKKHRNEKQRKKYNESEELREKQRERMRLYREKKKTLLTIAIGQKV
jgi:hypothetical protein